MCWVLFNFVIYSELSCLSKNTSIAFILCVSVRACVCVSMCAEMGQNCASSKECFCCLLVWLCVHACTRLCVCMRAHVCVCVLESEIQVLS
jgi:hypothetical protein